MKNSNLNSVLDQTYRKKTRKCCDVISGKVYYYQLICNNTVFRTKTRDIDVGSTYNALVDEKCAALLGFHSFTGCDQTGKFSGFSKLSCWKTFVKSKSSVLEAFAKLGEENVDITNSSKICKGLIDFVLDLHHHNRPAHVDTLQSLQWYLFSKFQLESQEFPPTPSALHHAICRSHCISHIWKQSHISSLFLLNPEGYGWKYDADEKTYDAFMTKQPPAPVSIVELCLCKCKSGCNTTMQLQEK